MQRKTNTILYFTQAKSKMVESEQFDKIRHCGKRNTKSLEMKKKTSEKNNKDYRSESNNLKRNYNNSHDKKTM